MASGRCLTFDLFCQINGHGVASENILHKLKKFDELFVKIVDSKVLEKTPGYDSKLSEVNASPGGQNGSTDLSAGNAPCYTDRLFPAYLRPDDDFAAGNGFRSPNPASPEYFARQRW
jgi:hypothetical protein